MLSAKTACAGWFRVGGEKFLRGVGRRFGNPGLRTGAIDTKPEIGRMAAGRPIVQTGLIGVLGSGRCAPRELRWRLAQKLALQHARANSATP